MPTTNEYLLEKIAELELEIAELKCNYDELAEHHQETVDFFEGLTAEHELLSKYLKPEKHLVTAIIDGDDAIKVAKMFHLNLMSIKE
jgi:hypothetical protein